MYNPNDDLSNIQDLVPGSGLGFDASEVALRWPEFDEEREIGRWKIGREDDGYVAVARHCTDTILDIPACSAELQTWAVIVGNKRIYGSFDNFVAKVEKATYEEGKKWSLSAFQNVYRGAIEFDGIKIQHDWEIGW